MCQPSELETYKAVCTRQLLRKWGSFFRNPCNKGHGILGPILHVAVSEEWGVLFAGGLVI